MIEPGTTGGSRPPHRSMTLTDRVQPVYRAHRFGSAPGAIRTERAQRAARTVRTEGSRR